MIFNRQVNRLLCSVASREKKRAQMLEKMINVRTSRGIMEENLYEVTHRRFMYGGLTRLRRTLFGTTIPDVPYTRIVLPKVKHARAKDSTSIHP